MHNRKLHIYRLLVGGLANILLVLVSMVMQVAVLGLVFVTHALALALKEDDQTLLVMLSLWCGCRSEVPSLVWFLHLGRWIGITVGDCNV